MIGFAPDMPGPTARLLRFDNFELDVRAGELRKRGRKLRLQGQPLQVLATLLRRAGDLVTRHELREQIWPADTFVDFDHSLHNAIARLREALGDSAETPRYIETLPRRGYRFIVPVLEVEDAAHTATPVRAAGARGIEGIAVLPLENLSGDRDQDYFADGMTEALITNLAKIKALRVISRTSAIQYKGARKSLPQIAQELRVDAVIEGSVLRSGERVRVTAQLIHAASDQHVWAESYERDFRDILSLQSEIACAIADQVRIVVTPEERARLDSARRVDPQAHELYLKARHHWNKRTEEGVRRAISLFHEALDQDPTSAHAYAGIADCYNILGYYNALPPLEAYPKAKAAALKALGSDQSLAEPHAALGVVKRDFEWDWEGAEAEFQRAIHLKPGYVEAYHWRSTLFCMLGQQREALREKSHALSMDPLSVVIRTDLARMFYFARDYDQALAEYQAALDMDHNVFTAHLWRAQVYELKGLSSEAIAELKMGMRLSNNSAYALARLAHGYAVSEQRDQARVLLKQLLDISTDKYISPYDVAMIYVGLGENEHAWTWLRKALEQRSPWMGYLKVEPQVDALRSDPRFQELVRIVGLPE